MLFDRFLRGGGLGGKLSNPLSSSLAEQELNSMSVAIQLRDQTEFREKVFRKNRECVLRKLFKKIIFLAVCEVREISRSCVGARERIL